MISPRFFLFGLLLSLFGCGAAPPQPTSADLRVLTEAQALLVIQQAASEFGQGATAGFDVSLTDLELAVDIGLVGGQPEIGVEWVSPQDREDSASLPSPAPGGELRIVADPEGRRVLLLEATSYRYTSRRDLVQAGATSGASVEARLRRDLRDFIRYAGLSRP